MRITVKQLKQLIREAVEEVMEEKDELKGDQDELDVAPPFGKLTGDDFKKLGRRSKAKSKKSLSEQDLKILQKMIEEGFFSKMGNKAAAAVGMRGKEKEELGALDMLYNNYSQKSKEQENNAIYNIQSWKQAITQNLGKVQGFEPYTVQNWNSAFEKDKGYLAFLEPLLDKLGIDKTPLTTLKDEIGKAATSLATNPSPIFVGAEWGKKIQGLIDQVANIMGTVPNAYEKKKQELNKRLGKA